MNSLDYQRIFHEIKNTITLVNSSMQLLDGKCFPLRSEYYWDNLKHEVTYLKNMILEISQAGNLEQLQKEPLEITPILQSICHFMKDTYPKLQWDLQLTQNLPVIYGDCTKLRQAILNLLKNAAEAQDGSGCITITTAFTDAAVQIAIIDSGGGIPAELEDKIFDLFITSKEQGTGLGLSIAKQIFESHGGSLHLENRYGEGCTFTIILPAAQETI